MADLQRRAKSATAEAPGDAHAVRPQRLQELQRQLRPPGRRRPAERLGTALSQAVAPFGGRAYRPGGDEFCVIADASQREALEQAATRALSETGEGFAISTAFGTVVIPHDTRDVTEAMRQADNAMYAQKHSGRATAGRQSTDVLLRALAERHPDLGDHLDGVTELVAAVAERLGIDGEELDATPPRRRPARHRQGRDPGRHHQQAHRAERRRVGLHAPPHHHRRTHHRRGPRARPAPRGWSAPPTRRFDGSGYPDGLANAEIPVGARIIAICDAFDAMISNRPYSQPKTTADALAELRRCAGTQFDPAIVPIFEQIITERARDRSERRRIHSMSMRAISPSSVSV